MNKKDEQIIKDSLDTIISRIPGLGLAWNLSRALYGAGLKLRQQRALEWVEMIRDNPLVFTEKILKDEKFQDGFVYALEKYIREKNEKKRKIMKDIFLGFSEVSSKESFELERMYQVLNILNSEDFLVLKDINVKRTDFHQIYENADQKNENIYNLISAGILMSDYKARIGPIAVPFVKITNFGKEFIKYLIR